MIDISISYRMHAPRRYSHVARLNPSPNFTNSDIKMFSMNAASSSDDIFFIAQRGTHEEHTSAIKLASFWHEFEVDVSLFQSAFDSATQKKFPINVDVFNVLSPKHSLHQSGNTFLATDDP